jgi:hypothetical protein
MLRKFFFVLLGLTLIVGLTNLTVSSTMAQVEKPPDNVHPTDQYFERYEDARLTNETYNPATISSTKTISSTDEFGYFWDDSAPFSWIDATNGTDTGLNSTSYYATGPITLPFPFEFYENTYNELWINPSGWITFSIQSLGVAMGPNST